MTISDELVAAAIKSLKADGVGVVPEIAANALQAVFAKLPECCKAEATAKSRYSDRQWAEGWNDCLAALAREFGGRE